jgi:hypothetical protein
MKPTTPVHGTTIGEHWASYLAEVVPAGASDVQREECKRAFYGGAQAMFACMLEAVAPDDETACESRVAALERELHDYIRLFSAREGI